MTKIRNARSLARREDPRLLAGRGRYVNNVQLPGMLHMKVLRSPHAHARIRAIDVKGALALPGVVSAQSAQDLAASMKPLPTSNLLPGIAAPEHTPLAVDRVRAVGDAVAVVVAIDPSTAVDALERIAVDYEPLPPVLDPEAALAPGAPLVHEELGSNLVYSISTGPPAPRLAEADVVVRQRMVNQRLIPSPMETRGVVADYRPFDDTLTLHLSTQAPHIVRTKLAELLDMPETRVRVVAGDVGGAFGSKFNVYPEDVLAATLSRSLGRPVKWIEGRSESATATTHGRGIIAYVEAGATREGLLVALHVRMLADVGAHVGAIPPTGALMACTMLSGPYKIPEITFEAQGVFTNKTPVDPYRGFYRAEATYFLERCVDLVARELEMDPVDLRRRNLIGVGELPYTTALGQVYDSGDFERDLDTALEMADYPALREEQRRLRQSGRYLGIGIASHVWRANFPTFPGRTPGLEFLVGGWEAASLRVERSGGVTVRTGASPHGQGLGNALATIVSETLGVPPEDVTVVAGDTDATPYGMGSAGSRSLVVAGSAVRIAAERVREKATELAAHLLEVPAAELVWHGPRVGARGDSARSLDLYELGRLACQGVRPAGMEPGLEAVGSFDPENFTYPSGAALCVVEVDPETGRVTLRDYFAVDDNGRVIHDAIVEGQVHGGTAQGIAQALFEEAVYDADGQLLSAGFLNYGMPSAPDLPSYHTRRVETLTARNPLGSKGAGEAGAIAAPPAVVNAVVDALAPFGVRHIDMPLTPERVWRAISGAGGR